MILTEELGCWEGGRREVRLPEDDGYLFQSDFRSCVLHMLMSKHIDYCKEFARMMPE